MPTIDGASLNALLSNPLVPGAFIAGALATLLVVLLVMMVRPAGGARRLLLPAVALALAGIAVLAILDRMARDERGAERRALAQRDAELTAQALAPGSALACLDGGAGEAAENACENTVFASPQSTAGAVSYMAARVTLLADGLAFARRGDPEFAATLTPLRRAIELDRFGIVAHVLAIREGCTAERCPAFALLGDTGAIKANFKAQVFDQYVSRYVAGWNRSEPKSEPVAEKPAAEPAPAPVASAPEPPAKTPVARKYDFPSAASIPPVSIMNAEPPLPKEGAVAPAAPPAGEHTASVPVPPKRPQTQAASPPVH
jgi:hypothetical protein